MDEFTRRTTIAGFGSVGIASLAGCSAGGFLGPSFEEGDEQEVMLEVEWFGDDWEKTEEDDPEEATETGEEDGDDSSDDEIDLGFEPEEVPFAASTFEQESDDGLSLAFAMVGILDDDDQAQEGVEDLDRREMVNSEDPEIGDTATRGDIDSIGVIYYHIDNAAVFTGAASVSGFNLEPDHGKSLDMAEEIESRLNDL